ncbi:transmembrane protein, putative (macronuclear) [Tetrahymena thermophila SB210]|uniref:Transmembrane protein, putative n=1 Tax=Tetrahymena thermophila (strain SB210) TaxID=312017 RepID=Q23AK7_TETTS|nr:transmembrane protein, putative [Tetrahymena thermophila SB210]EAR93485.2 transmembrane protein, putative [Tetrahymena thermophila SB210]|eukprot:XP_001013730.2 transmembrane protein, putative [Tetrahymena thermophila SB210]
MYLNNHKETNAIVYKAYPDKRWRYSTMDQNGNISQTYQIIGMEDLSQSYYILENQLLYFFTDQASEYQLIDLNLLTSNKQGYYSSQIFQHSKRYCYYPMIRKYGPLYYFLCLDYYGFFCLQDSSIQQLKTSQNYIKLQPVYYQQTYFLLDGYIVYKNIFYTTPESADYILIDQTFDIFLQDKKLCKARMNGQTFNCSKTYYFGVIYYYSSIILSKVFDANGINLIFVFDYNYDKYVFFDASSLEVIKTNSDSLKQTNNPKDIIQYLNYVFIQGYIYQVTYNPSLSQVDIKQISSPSDYNNYQTVNYPFKNFQLGETILLMKNNEFWILNIKSLFPSNTSKCPQNCYSCQPSTTNLCLYCNEGYDLIDNGQCQQRTCIQNCNQCKDSQTCQLCKVGYLLQFNNTCSEKCPISAQIDKNNSKCICDQNANLISGQCQCYTQYYMNINQCKQCIPNCDKCIDQTKCTSCSLGFYLYEDGSCNFCNTQGGYFISDNMCLPCQKNCLICSDKNTCTQFIQCGAQFTYDTIQQKCVQCLWDTQKNQCVDKCKNNQFNDKIKMTCSQCYFQNDVCIQQCPQGYYADLNFQCQMCHKSCMACNGPNQNQCLRCQKQYFLLDDQTCQICQYQHFLDSVSNECHKCHNSCKSCTGPLPNNCLSCNINFIFYQNTSECLTETQIQNLEIQKQKLIYANCDLIQSDCSSLSNLSDFIQKLFLGLFILTQILIFTYFCLSSSNLLGWYYIQIVQLIGNLAFNKNMNLLWLNIGFLKNVQSYNLFNLITYNPFQNQLDILINFNKFSLGIAISDFYKNFIQNSFYQLAGLVMIFLFILLSYILKNQIKLINRMHNYLVINSIIRYFMITSNILLLSSFSIINQKSFTETFNLCLLALFGSIYFLIQMYCLIQIITKPTLEENIFVLQIDLQKFQKCQSLFWIVFELRKIICTLTIIFLSEFQFSGVVMASASLFYLLFIIFFKPVQNKSYEFAIIFTEIFCIALFSIFNIISNRSQFNISPSIATYCTICFVVLVLVLKILFILLFCKEIYISIKNYFTNRNLKSIESLQNSQLQIQQFQIFNSITDIEKILSAQLNNSKINWQKQVRNKK